MSTDFQFGIIIEERAAPFQKHLILFHEEGAEYVAIPNSALGWQINVLGNRVFVLTNSSGEKFLFANPVSPASVPAVAPIQNGVVGTFVEIPPVQLPDTRYQEAVFASSTTVCMGVTTIGQSGSYISWFDIDSFETSPPHPISAASGAPTQAFFRQLPWIGTTHAVWARAAAEAEGRGRIIDCAVAPIGGSLDFFTVEVAEGPPSGITAGTPFVFVGENYFASLGVYGVVPIPLSGSTSPVSSIHDPQMVVDHAPWPAGEGHIFLLRSFVPEENILFHFQEDGSGIIVATTDVTDATSSNNNYNNTNNPYIAAPNILSLSSNSADADDISLLLASAAGGYEVIQIDSGVPDSRFIRVVTTTRHPASTPPGPTPIDPFWTNHRGTQEFIV